MADVLSGIDIIRPSSRTIARDTSDVRRGLSPRVRGKPSQLRISDFSVRAYPRVRGKTESAMLRAARNFVLPASIGW
jgi:hypothetical protein